jgi:hypothetical protein
MRLAAARSGTDCPCSWRDSLFGSAMICLSASDAQLDARERARNVEKFGSHSGEAACRSDSCRTPGNNAHHIRNCFTPVSVNKVFEAERFWIRILL